MSQRIDWKILQREVAEKILESYPYFLIFYFLSLIISFFSVNWSGLFYWPAFHVLAIIFSLLFAWSVKLDFAASHDPSFIGFVRGYLRQTAVRLFGLGRRDWLKASIIAIVMILAMLHGIGAADFFVLLYGLLAVLFILDSSWSAVVAIALLTFCPFLLAFKQDPWAENAAVYAFYFLSITVLVQIRELKRAG